MTGKLLLFGAGALALLIASGAAIAQDVAGAVAGSSDLKMPLGSFLDYCNAGNQTICIRRLGQDEAEYLDTNWMAGGGSICWPQDNRGLPDVQQIGQQMLNWLNAHPERRADPTDTVISDADASLYPCAD